MYSYLPAPSSPSTLRQKVSSTPFSCIQLPHVVCKSLRLYVSGSEAKLKVELGLSTLLGLNQNFPYVIRRVPSCHAMQVGKGEGELKKKIKKWATCQVFIEWKIGAPERNKCLELLTLLPYHFPTQSDGHTHPCQNMLCSWAWRQVSSLTGCGSVSWGFIRFHMKDYFFACTWCLGF